MTADVKERGTSWGKIQLEWTLISTSRLYRTLVVVVGTARRRSFGYVAAMWLLNGRFCRGGSESISVLIGWSSQSSVSSEGKARPGQTVGKPQWATVGISAEGKVTRQLPTSPRTCDYGGRVRSSTQ